MSANWKPVEESGWSVLITKKIVCMMHSTGEQKICGQFPASGGGYKWCCCGCSPAIKAVVKEQQPNYSCP
jgi:hypothetical protein